ncbi:MAG: dehydrogenase, partial [Gordonibacter sp.]
MTKNVKGTPIVKGLGFNSFGIGTNACSVDIDEENDKILRIRPLHFDEHQTPEELNAWKIEARGQTFEPGFKTLISPLSLCYKKRVYS